MRALPELPWLILPIATGCHRTTARLRFASHPLAPSIHRKMSSRPTEPVTNRTPSNSSLFRPHVLQRSEEPAQASPPERAGKKAADDVAQEAPNMEEQVSATSLAAAVEGVADASEEAAESDSTAAPVADERSAAATHMDATGDEDVAGSRMETSSSGRPSQERIRAPPRRRSPDTGRGSTSGHASNAASRRGSGLRLMESPGRTPRSPRPDRRSSSPRMASAETTPNIAGAESVVAKAWQAASPRSSPRLGSRNPSRLSVNQPVMSEDFVAESIVARAWQRAEAAAASDVENESVIEHSVWEEHGVTLPFDVRAPKLGIAVAAMRGGGPSGVGGVEVCPGMEESAALCLTRCHGQSG